MLKMGIPHGAVQQALKKEGKHPWVIDMDPEKSYSSQAKGKGADVKKEIPLQEDQEYAQFFKVRLTWLLCLCRSTLFAN